MSDEKISALSKSDTAFFIRAVYDSLIVPDWNRGDVIDLGSNILKKVPLASFGDKLLGRLLPSLTRAAESLHDRMTSWLAEQHRQLISEYEQVTNERDKLAADFAALSRNHHALEADHQKIVSKLEAYMTAPPAPPAHPAPPAPPAHPAHPAHAEVSKVDENAAPAKTEAEKPITP